jgi:hypothetical protein
VGNEQENAEKIAKIEQKVETTFEWFKDALSRIESKLDASIDRFVSKDMFNEVTSGLQKQISEIREDKKTHKNILPLWIALVPSVVLAIVEIINLLHK